MVLIFTIVRPVIVWSQRALNIELRKVGQSQLILPSSKNPCHPSEEIYKPPNENQDQGRIWIFTRFD
jgi:hypothetical protein